MGISLFHSCTSLESALSIPYRAIPCHPIPSNTNPTHIILSRPIPSYVIPSHPISCHPISFYPIPYHPVPSHPIPSHIIPSYPLPSYPLPSHPMISLPSCILSYTKPSYSTPFHPLPSYPILCNSISSAPLSAPLPPPQNTQEMTMDEYANEKVEEALLKRPCPSCKNCAAGCPKPPPPPKQKPCSSGNRGELNCRDCPCDQRDGCAPRSEGLEPNRGDGWEAPGSCPSGAEVRRGDMGFVLTARARVVLFSCLFD